MSEWLISYRYIYNSGPVEKTEIIGQHPAEWFTAQSDKIPNLRPVIIFALEVPQEVANNMRRREMMRSPRAAKRELAVA